MFVNNYLCDIDNKYQSPSGTDYQNSTGEAR